MLSYSLIIAAVAILGGLIPLFAGRSDRVLHLFISFATGIFLGVVFLHMLPEVAELAQNGGPAVWGTVHGAESPGLDEPHAGGLLWLCVLVGVVGLWVLQNLVIGGSDREQHATLGYAAFLGLCVHAFTAGMGLAAASTQPDLGRALFLSIALHKASEGFSLGTVFRLAGYKRSLTLVLVSAFALVTPFGVLIGSGLVEYLPEQGVEILTALAAGTFLFVALYDLLPEVFHHREDVLVKIVLLALGVALSTLVPEVAH